MGDLLREYPRDFKLVDVEPATKARWRGSTVEVRARLVPRHLWTTASIDVLLDGQCVLRTGGERTITGSRSAEIHHDGAVHKLKLSWGRVQRQGFTRRRLPYQLKIDGAELAASHVAVENAWLVVVPYLAVASYFVLRTLAALR